MKKFFIACNLDFEAELETELGEIWPFLLALDGKPHSEPLQIIERVPGGVVIENSWHLGLQINFFSKLANRVLLRLVEFRARDFPKLFQKIKTLQKDPLLAGKRFRYEVAASQSRLNNEKRIREILVELFGSETEGIQENQIETLFVRMHDDLCSVSLDTSGTHLHKRSELWKTGPAPLRETLAAFCGRKLIEDKTWSELQDVILIDPMAGTGTLLLETALLWQLSPRTDFPFMNWSQTPKIFSSPSFRRGYVSFPKIFKSVIALDRDPVVLAIANERLKASGLEFQVRGADLMESSPAPEVPCFVISNPPYGERLQADFRPLELLQKIAQVYRPQRMGLLFSEAQAKLLRKELKTRQEDLQVQMQFKIRSDFQFRNGGLLVHFMVFVPELGLPRHAV